MNSYKPSPLLWCIAAFLLHFFPGCLTMHGNTVVDASTLTGKFMFGYQGWHACQGDGSAMNKYVHWGHLDNARPSTNDLVDDIWPDLSEFDVDELFPTDLVLGNGQPAKVYSCYKLKTVERHFKWMRDHNLDGVAFQRFIKDVKLDANWEELRNKNLQNVRSAAETYGRVFYLMYDVSNDDPSLVADHLKSDWTSLVSNLQITNSSRYLRHKGKPLVALWGFGFPHVGTTPGEAQEIINWFKTNGCTVMGGVPYYWRFLNNDSQTNAAWANVYRSYDVISPWAVGRYSTIAQADSFKTSIISPDLAECNRLGIDYMPVVYPGYSSFNLNGVGGPNSIPRLGGRFYWRQIYNALSAGCPTLFGAMFDEVDEGTATYKLAPTMSTTPQGVNMFALDVDGESLPNDWYLRLGDQGTKALRNESSLSEVPPISPTNSISLEAPLGGETWIAGASAGVSWNTTGAVSAVNIDLSTDAGSSWSRIAYNVTNSGMKWLTVPYVATTAGRIRVSEIDGTPVDWSDTNFAIRTNGSNRRPHLRASWNLPPGSRSYLTVDSASAPNQRSLAYNSLSNHVYILSRTTQTSGLSINVLDANTGEQLYRLNTAGISGGSIVLLSIAAAEDGAIYASNMSSSGGAVANFKLYRWANAHSNTAPVLVYSGEPGSRTDSVRWGDTLAVKGAGTNTRIIIDAHNTNLVAVLTPVNQAMTSWVATCRSHDFSLGKIGRSLQFGPTNTFWQKRKGERLQVSSYDLNLTNSPRTFTANIFTNYHFLPDSIGPVAIDFERNLLAGINFAGATSSADSLDLYDVSDWNNPLLLSKYPFPTNQQPNGNFIGQVLFVGDRLFTLDGNNGAMGFTVAAATPPALRFDVATFCCTCSPDDHLCMPQFEHLNWVSDAGHFLAMGNDDRRALVEANGNFIAAYYNTLTTGFTTNSGARKAAIINDYVVNLFTRNGPRPDWVLLNEISAGQWPTNAVYRAWVHDVAHELKHTYGYNVVVFSPFSGPGTSNAADWRALAEDAYIGVENYLSGAEIKAQNFSVSWCQSRYQSSVNTYGACGVPKSRLMLTEHFGQTGTHLDDGTVVTWGRNTVSYEDWDRAIVVRSKAALNVGFPGFLTYAWAKNAMLATDAELMHFEDTYRTNPLPAMITTAPAVLVSSPANQTNDPGTTAVFSIAVSGTSPINYQWKRNGTNLVDGGKFSGAMGPTLTITDVVQADAGPYSVFVGNATAQFESTSALSVIDPPFITTQPVSRTNALGTTTTFSVRVDGTPPFNFQWRKDGGALAGATQLDLILTNIQRSDAGTYSVIITNRAGSITSSNATLTVLTPPIIVSQPQSREVGHGTNVTFSVVATGAEPMSFEWRRAGSPLSDGGNVSGSDTSALMLSGVGVADENTYSVVVSNDLGRVESAPAVLTVVDPPIITVHPTTQTNTVGSTVTFVASATGSNLMYQWRKDGLALADSSNISGATTATLTLSNLTRINTGGYSLLVTNGAGSVASVTAGLVVIYLLPFADPFDYPTGVNLGGQVNEDGLLWSDIGTSSPGPHVSVASTNLTVSGLATSTGNSIKFGGLGKSARFSLAPSNAVTSATLYYSFLLNVHDLAGASTTGGFIAGFNNSTGTQTGQPSVVGTRVYIRSTGPGYNIGLSKNSSTVTDWAWDARVFTTNDVLLVVGSYTFNQLSGTDDVSKLWINPASADFGETNAPPPDLVNSNGNDINANQIASFVFLQRSSTTEPAEMIADELRLARNWAGVTPDSPTIAVQPVSQTVNMGSEVQFHVTASGPGLLSYEWRHNATNTVGSNSSLLILTNVGRAHRGNYRVTISNEGGSVTSTNAVLHVLVPQKLEAATMLSDGSFQFTAKDADGGLLTGDDLQHLQVQSSTNLVTWTTLTNRLSLTNGSLLLIDSDQTNNVAQYYRIVEL